MNDFKQYTLEELLNAAEWTIGPPGKMHGTPVSITEQQAIELAIRAVCSEKGTSTCGTRHLMRPSYNKRLSWYRKRDGSIGPDQWGWCFWFHIPMPKGFEDRSSPVFVNDPSGVVEFGASM